jgi:hypothetical protein
MTTSQPLNREPVMCDVEPGAKAITGIIGLVDGAARHG